jgi:flavin reductase (DIM6/NTAB) family NADH-FMN oxidoreductase RutF
MSAALDRLVSLLDYPMAIVTAAAPDGANGVERSGCLVGFTTQCSIKPMRYLVCISKLNHTFGVACRAETLVVHFPTAGPSNRDLAALFGVETGDEVDKFSRCQWTTGPDGVTPVLVDITRWFAGPILDRIDVGDHVGFVVAPTDARCDDDGPQLGFQMVKGLEPGHPV